MKQQNKETERRTSPKTKLLVVLVGILAILFIFWGIAETTRPTDLRDLNPEDYADNPELYKFAMGLVDTNPDSLSLLDMRELDYSNLILNDKRYVDLLILCLREKETFPQKLIRFISAMKDYVSFSDLFWITDLWNEFLYVLQSDEKAWFREQALGYLSDLEEKAFPAVPEICRVMKEDSQLETRQAALFALERIQSPEAFPHIIGLIHDKEFQPEDLTPSLVVSARLKEQVMMIVSYLESEDERFRLLAINTLLYLTNIERDLSKRIYEKTRIMLVKDPSVDVRMACVDMLNALVDSDPTCEVILSALENEKNSFVIQRLIEGLAYYANAADYLIEVAKGPTESELQSAAIKSLGTIIRSNSKLKEEIQDCLVALVKSQHTLPSVREECLKQLAYADNGEFEELILEWIKTKYQKKDFSFDDIYQLIRIRNKRVIDFMVKVINEQANPKTRFMKVDEIVFLIDKLGDYKSAKVNSNLKKIFKDSSFNDKIIQDSLLEILAINDDKEAVLIILNGLKQKDLQGYSRWQLLEILKKCDSPVYMEYLAEHLKDRRDMYNFPSIFSSFNLKDERVYNEILAIVNDENIEVGLRCDAIEGLRRASQPGSEAEIRRIREDKAMPALMRLKAADELSPTDYDESLLCVSECLNHENLKVRREARYVLWAFNQKDVLPILEKRAKKENDYSLRNEIINMVREIKEDIVAEKAAEEEFKELEKELKKE